MKSWFQIILEWLNCLDILERNIKDLKELEDEKFYRKLIELFSWKDLTEISSTENIVKKFLQDEYPEFKFYDEPLGQIEHIYIASLFLLHTCQEPLFHQPMCNKLQHETQIKIKMYLEMIIPYGRNISRETLKKIIIELEDDIPKTPVTPQRQNLKDFFYSPITRSAQNYKLLNEKNHELRKLKTKLEVERFEKADLQEDLRIQQNKIQNLHKKLQEKTAEIKALRGERMESNTPQSCEKNENNKDYEQHYKKEIDYLENQLVQKQCEIDKFEIDNDILLKKLACLEKQCIYFKEKSENFEKSFENLQVQAEIKDRELINLRLTNEELCTHLKELTETGLEEQSFEIDEIAPLNSTLSPFNNSEVLSSVIEIQLQEAKEESASLKAQIDVLTKKLDLTNQEKDSLLHSTKVCIQILKENLYAFATEFRLTKKDILNQLNEYQRQDGETVKIILNASEKIYNSFTEEQFCRRKTEKKLADNKKELKDCQNLNTTLENNLTKSKLIINDLEKELMGTKERLMESVQKLKELEETKEILEKHHKTLKSQHEKILLDLCNINDKLKFSQLETCNMSNQLKSKDEKIENLIAEITSLKGEKEHIISLQREREFKMKSFITDLEAKLLEKQCCLDQLNIETKLKQETLELDEMKMKEIIMNFQKVGTNQNAILITQEKTLKEKDLQIEQLQKEFNESKSAFHKQLEDEKLLNQIKLDEIKQRLKTTYNEQIIKLNREQEQCIHEKLESLQKKMELQCRKQAEEINKYKAHVTDMSSQIWNVGEKLLSERQEKEKLQKELIQLKEKYQNLDQQTISSIEHKTFKYERRDLLSEENEVLHKVTVPKEKTTDEKRCSIRNIQTMGNAFHAEDEEGEVFDNIYLADMKNGHSSFNIDTDRVSILQKRNALCKPHLKSSYPAEMQFHPLPFTEDEIKSGSTPDEIFNDSLSQSLLPEQKTKRRDRTLTSYKKPGPPTPSKNGGRLSLQGNELKTPNSRILRDRNKDRATATSRTLRNLFNLKRQDENVVITPKGHRRSRLFRKYCVGDS